MSEIALRVRDLGKLYRIGAAPERYRTLRDALAGAVRAPVARLKAVLAGGSTILSDDEIWALDGVSFDVQQGEVVGVIGRNGAGKTTLLKVLSRITEPTRGRAEIHGRVASLLEVGTGFHPELTGRENIFLNGAILGMRRDEIEAKFDEIVAFAEVERFIDTQVKHYSSGMYLRLAFAVAAHLEPEILLVDEVLAVGDAAFQRKCLGKMQEVSEKGRTVLFVSHNMTTIRQLCDRCILLDQGRVVLDGPTDSVIDDYLRRSAVDSRGELALERHRFTHGIRFSMIRMLSKAGGELSAPKNFQPFLFEIDFETEETMAAPMITIAVDTADNVPLTRITTGDEIARQTLPPGRHRIRFETTLPFSPGRFVVLLRADQVVPSSRPLTVLPHALSFELHESRDLGFEAARRHYRKGLVPVASRWHLTRPHAEEVAATNEVQA